MWIAKYMCLPKQERGNDRVIENEIVRKRERKRERERERESAQKR